MSKLVRHSQVDENHRVQLELPELPPGTAVEITVHVEAPPNEPEQPLISFLGAVRGLFKTPEEADEFIRSERDKWD